MARRTGAAVARHLLAVAVTNDADEPVSVTRLQLRATRFDPVPAVPQDVGEREVVLELPPGNGLLERLRTGPY